MSRTFEPSERFRDAVARFDRANAEDPNVETADGAPHPKEVLYAQRMFPPPLLGAVCGAARR